MCVYDIYMYIFLYGYVCVYDFYIYIHNIYIICTYSHTVSQGASDYDSGGQFLAAVASRLFGTHI